jgi:Polyketide cyclase / dehydrase and lipid transport
MNEPSAQGSVAIAASPDRVFTLVSDLPGMAELADEFSGGRWLGGATASVVGARFKGTNRNGWRGWSTIATVTDADPGALFGFEVSYLGLPISRWEYAITPAGAGCTLIERTWDRRAAWVRFTTSLWTWRWQRTATNAAHIASTLERVRLAAEGADLPA